MVTKARDLAIAALCAWLGYMVFLWIGFPAAPLTGATAGITLAALAGLKADLPVPLRNACILGLGINIGTAVTPEVLQGMLAWPLSLAILTLCVLAILFASAALLQRLFGYDRQTAMLAAAPGHLSYVLGIALASGRDVPAIAVIQSIRVLILTLCVPPLISVVFGATGVSVLPENVMGLSSLLGTVLLSVPMALVFARIGVPAAWLIAGMVVSATGHGSGFTPGRLPDAMAVTALMAMGILIGSRFASVPARQLGRYILPGLMLTVVAIGICLVGAGLALLMLGVPPGLLTVAFAPGGVEAMAAIALSLGYDPTFVAGHHVFRLLVLSVVMPLVVGRVGRQV